MTGFFQSPNNCFSFPEISILLLSKANNLRYMTPEEEKEHHHNDQRRFLIPAGLFIGLGIGLLFNYPGAGLLIGMGFGFIASTFPKPSGISAGDAAVPGMHREPRWIMAFLGVFFILLGISIVWAPPNFWPYLGAGFLILLGIWFFLRSFGKA